MKILKLIFENINSLKGKWQIDFEDEAFNNHALFAITGPTGAGKTTILDAICLALYGETPRLNVSAANNEFMSIGTAFASSTVIFRANNTIYQASWSQRRANQKSDGKLQSIHREISELKHADDTEGKILEDKPSQANKQIEHILGMNKAQFTRSVMLVQGQFAAFLQSNAADRGQILEQITGTQIYAKIGQAAHEKNKAQNRLLKELQLKLGEVRLLDSKERQALLDKITHIKQQQHTLTLQLEQHQSQLNLTQQYHQFSQELQLWQDKLLQHQADLDDFKPQAKQLAQAKKAQNLYPSYQALTEVRTEHQQKTTELTKLTDELCLLKDSVNTQKSTQQNIQNHLNEAMQRYEAIKPALQAVRTLDRQITSATQEQAYLTQNLQQQQQDRQAAISQIQQIQHDQTKLKSAIQKINEQLNQDDHSTLQDSHQQCQRNQAQFDSLATAVKHAYQLQVSGRQKLKNDIEHLEKFRSDYESVNNQIADTDGNIQSIREQLFALFKIPYQYKNDQFDFIQLSQDKQQQLKSQTQLRYTLEQIAQNYRQYLPLYQEQNDLLSTQNQLSQQKSDARQQLNAADDALQQAEHQQLIAAENFELHKQILHMKAHFDKLQHGDPCPVCGSTEHPYKHNPTHLDGSGAKKAEAQLIELDNQVNQHRKSVQTHQKDLHTLEVMIQNNANRLSTLSESIKQMHQQLTASWSQIQHHFADLDDFADLDKITDAIKSTDEHTHELENELQQASAFIQELNNHQNTKDKLNAEKIRLQQAGKKMNKDTQDLFKNLQDEYVHFYHTLLPPLFALLNAQMRISAADERMALQYLVTHLQEIQTSLMDFSHFVNIINDPDTKPLNKLPASSKLSLPAALDTERFTAVDSAIAHTLKQFQTKITEADKLTGDLNHKQTELVRLDTQMQSYHSKANELSPAIDALTKTIQSHSEHIDALNDQRKALIDGDPDEVERSYQEQISTHRLELERITEDLHADHANLSAHTAAIDGLHTIINELSDKQNRNLMSFENALAESAFDSQAQFLQAMLSAEELSKLEHTLDELNRSVTEAQISRNNNQEKLTALMHDHPNIAKLDADALQSTVDELQEQLMHIHQQFGEQNALQAADAANRERHSELLAAIKKQEETNAIWAQLDSLIGSSKGEKYRNFVQGLTLDLVLHHANQILSKMNDRYLLTFDGDSDTALEILVTDLHQGDAVRSTKNLSGGESFIISLALALGLSQINSKNVQIESLFLDEGFGTLDETALDLALNTLFELQQSGKSIGIISHVPSLKERIDTQIIVEKHAGGNSILKGAGVSRL